jgi:hypothetical protein
VPADVQDAGGPQQGPEEHRAVAEDGAAIGPVERERVEQDAEPDQAQDDAHHSPWREPLAQE